MALIWPDTAVTVRAAVGAEAGVVAQAKAGVLRVCSVLLIVPTGLCFSLTASIGAGAERDTDQSRRLVEGLPKGNDFLAAATQPFPLHSFVTSAAPKQEV